MSGFWGLIGEHLVCLGRVVNGNGSFLGDELV